MRDVEELFNYFKSRIDFGIFVIDSNNTQADASKQVIINVANAIKPKKINNYLIVLNKIDRAPDQNKAINNAKSILINNVLQKLNLSNNVFIPLDSRQLQHQTKMKESFEHFLLFLFNEYIAKAVTPFKDGQNEANEYKTDVYSFNEFLKEFLSNGKDDDEFNEYLDSLEEKFDDKYDFNELKVGQIIEKMKKEEETHVNYDIDLEEDDHIKLFKGIYIYFKEQKNFPFSVNVNKIFEYFEDMTKKLKNYENYNPAPVVEEENQIIPHNFRKQFEKFVKIFQNCDESLKKKLEAIDSLNESIEQLYNYILNQQIIYIGIFGNSSTGKSMIYNDIFGYNILTVHTDETTRRGIIIEYDETIGMYFAKTEEKQLEGKKFYTFQRGDLITRNEDQIKEYLSFLNKEFAKHTDNTDNEYFIVTLPIKFFDEIGLDKEIRKRIKFIDTPGYNTTGSKEFDYTPLMESISCCLINFKKESLNSVDNKTNIYEDLRDKAKRIKSDKNFQITKYCLFIVNIFKDDEPPETKIIDWKRGIKKLIELNVDDNNLNLDLTYFRADQYNFFLNENRKYFDYYYLLKEMLGIFKKEKKKSFIKFFTEKIKANIKNLFNKKDKEIKELVSNEMKKEIYEEMDLLFKSSQNVTGFFPEKEKKYEEYLKDICIYLTYAQKNIKNIKFYKSSYVDIFFHDLYNKILDSKKVVDEDFREHLKSTVELLNIFFETDINNHNQEKKEKFMKESQKLYKEFENTLDKYKFEKLFNEFINDLKKFFENKKNSAKYLLQNNNNKIDKAISEIQDELESLLAAFQEKIKNEYNNFVKEVEEKLRNLIGFLNLSENQNAKMNFSPNIQTNVNVGGIIGNTIAFSAILGLGALTGVFPILSILTVPATIIASIFMGESLAKIIFKDERLKTAIDETKTKVIEKIEKLKSNFLKRLEEKKANLKCKATKLISFKAFQLSAKTVEEKEFYLKLKEEYDSLYKNIKIQFNI